MQLLCDFVHARLCSQSHIPIIMCVNPIGAKRLGYPQKVLLDLGTQPYARLQRGGGGSWRKALKKMRKRKKMRKKKKMPLPTTLEAEGS